jgi:hypothetical protein
MEGLWQKEKVAQTQEYFIELLELSVLDDAIHGARKKAEKVHLSWSVVGQAGARCHAPKGGGGRDEIPHVRARISGRKCVSLFQRIPGYQPIK